MIHFSIIFVWCVPVAFTNSTYRSVQLFYFVRAPGSNIHKSISDLYTCFLFYSHAGLEFSVLAQRVLAEVPDQVLNYMELHRIKPNKIEA